MNRTFLISIFFVFTLMTLFPDTKDNIIINVPKTISSAPLIELDGEKIDGRLIKIEFFDDHIMTMAEFVNGGIQVFMTGFSQGLSYYKTSHDIVMISNPVWGVSLLLTNDPKINDITGFQGKTILVPFAKSPLDLQLKAILKKKGLLDKVAVDFAPIQQQVPMLISQKAAGICIPEPLASKLIHDKNAYKVFSFSEEWASVNGNDPRSPQVSIFVKKEFAASNKKFFIDLNKAIVKKINFIKKDPDGISKKYSSVFSLDHDIIKSSLKNVILEIPDLKTEKKICVSYEKAIEDQDVINDDFFFEY